MPVCQFFLRGKCSNDNCPYSHVNVSKKAEVCEDFLKGFCSRGQQVCLLLLFIILLFAALVFIAFALELHLTPEKITEAFRLLTCIVDSQILEMHICVSMLS